MIINWARDESTLTIVNLEAWCNNTKKLISSFTSVDFSHVYREYNMRADSLSKDGLLMTRGHLTYMEYSKGDTFREVSHQLFWFSALVLILDYHFDVVSSFGMLYFLQILVLWAYPWIWRGLKSVLDIDSGLLLSFLETFLADLTCSFVWEIIPLFKNKPWWGHKLALTYPPACFYFSMIVLFVLCLEVLEWTWWIVDVTNYLWFF